jgi:histone-lysine N-methyltransferase SETMAR
MNDLYWKPAQYSTKPLGVMDDPKFEHRAVIKFLTAEGSNAKEIHNRLVVVYGNESPVYSTVAKWNAEFRRGRTSLKDDPRSGRPVEVVTEDLCAAVETTVMADRRLKIREIVAAHGISKGSVHLILHERLGLSKVCARWVPRFLTPIHRSDRVDISRENLDRIRADTNNFYSRCVTGDETWLYHFDPESKQESMQWKHAQSPTPTKFRTQASAGKVMATIFWDAQGVIHMDYLPHKTTITGQYYADLLLRLRHSIKEKRRGMLSRGVLLLHDNAPVHAAKIAQVALNEAGFQQLPHPAYSPDLAPSDFHLFRHLKANLRGQRFRADNEVCQAAEAFLASKSSNWYLDGIQMLEHRYEKCIYVGGDYVEKI